MRSRRSELGIHLDPEVFQKLGGQNATGVDNHGVVLDLELFVALRNFDMFRRDIFDI